VNIDPLALVKNKEIELYKKFIKKQGELTDKVNHFLVEQEQLLSDLPNQLKSEREKINKDQDKIKAEKIASLQQLHAKEIEKINNVKQETIDQLADYIVKKIIEN
jgi:hypothetical protein